MPYALFTKDEQISKAYRTKQEVWKKADEAGLVVDAVSEEEKQPPGRVLDEDYQIKCCPPETSGEIEPASRSGPAVEIMRSPGGNAMRKR